MPLRVKEYVFTVPPARARHLSPHKPQPGAPLRTTRRWPRRPLQRGPGEAAAARGCAGLGLTRQRARGWSSPGPPPPAGLTGRSGLPGPRRPRHSRHLLPHPRARPRYAPASPVTPEARGPVPPPRRPPRTFSAQTTALAARPLPQSGRGVRRCPIRALRDAQAWVRPGQSPRLEGRDLSPWQREPGQPECRGAVAPRRTIPCRTVLYCTVPCRAVPPRRDPQIVRRTPGGRPLHPRAQETPRP